MADPILQSRTEAVQPSLWDRLVDDLPGIVSETDRQRADLAARIGAGKVEAVLAGGPRSVEADEDFDPDTRRDLHLFLTRMARRAFLEERGIVVNAAVLREAVRRDIEALFNVERFESGLQLTDLEQKGFETPQDIIADFPHVRRSVLNYGVPSFSGRAVSDFDLAALAKELREEEIRVVALCPGPVDTPMRWAATPDFDRKVVISTETVAQYVSYVVILPRGTTMSELLVESMHYD